MKLRLKFVWPDPKKLGDRKLLGFGTIIRDVEDAEDVDDAGRARVTMTIWVNTRTFLSIAILGTLLTWAGAAGGLYYWLHRNPYNRVVYADVVWPWRWPQIRDLRGRALIAEGLDDLKARRLEAGMFKIRVGLFSCPRDLAARLAVAQTYMVFGYYPGAREIMLPALDWPDPPRAWAGELMDWAVAGDDWATVLLVCERTLARPETAGPDGAWFLHRKFDALLALRQPVEALAVLDDPRLARSVELRRMRIAALCEAGRAAEAVAVAQAWPPDVEPVLVRGQMLALALREAGRFDEMRVALDELKAKVPVLIEPRLVAIEYYTRAGWMDRAWLELRACLERFDTQPGMIEQIAQVCANIEAPELLRLCLEDAQELGLPEEEIQIKLAVLFAIHGDFERAVRVVRAENAARPGTSLAQRLLAADQQPAVTMGLSLQMSTSVLGTVSAMQLGSPRVSPAVTDMLYALLDCARDDSPGARAKLAAMLARHRLTLRAYADGIKVLANAGRWSAAGEMAEAGLAAFPRSRELQAQRARAAEKIAAPSAGLPVPLRTGDVENGRVAAGAGASAEKFAASTPVALIAELDAVALRRAWGEQRNLIVSVRNAAPAWLGQLDAELAWREVRCAAEMDEMKLALRLLVQRLGDHKIEAIRALALARECRERGDAASARAFATKIVETVPEFRPAREFLAMLGPPPK